MDNKLKLSIRKDFDHCGSLLRPKDHAEKRNVSFTHTTPINAGINFIHNHPPAHPLGFAPKICPYPGLLHPSFYPGSGDLLGQLPRGGHLSINDVCHFLNIRYNVKNWRLTTLWGLLVALKFYTFLKKIIQS